MPSRYWNRDEVLVAFNLYCRTAFGRLHSKNPEIIRLAQKLGRTPSALAMKCCNLAALDPVLQERGIKGLSGASKLDRDIWEEFENHPEDVGYESELAVARTTGARLRLEPTIDWNDIKGLDREATRKVRVNQNLFRTIILTSYGMECSICKLPLPKLLVASHIVAWAEAPGERMNPRNGICLCVMHDKAFDTGILTITGDYEIRVSSQLKEHATRKCVETSFLDYHGNKLHLPERWHPDPALLRRHAELAC